ncbi:hypothetical protein SAY87_008046 [Trapa incisa]|uniref:Uncharacterized protein n=1 Tax=Trapa incisa TaxID=236973 RepID=A0AAN7KFE3_9MYRT|nr:hypothetical protein SAY87_008046 [Trapa incisa]
MWDIPRIELGNSRTQKNPRIIPLDQMSYVLKSQPSVSLSSLTSMEFLMREEEVLKSQPIVSPSSLTSLESSLREEVLKSREPSEFPSSMTSMESSMRVEELIEDDMTCNVELSGTTYKYPGVLSTLQKRFKYVIVGGGVATALKSGGTSESPSSMASMESSMREEDVLKRLENPSHTVGQSLLAWLPWGLEAFRVSPPSMSQASSAGFLW